MQTHEDAQRRADELAAQIAVLRKRVAITGKRDDERALSVLQDRRNDLMASLAGRVWR